MAQRPTASSNTTNTLSLLKSNSEVVTYQKQEFSNGAGVKTIIKSSENKTPEPEENIDATVNNNDELINLVVNSGSPNSSKLASYNSYSAVVTPFDITSSENNRESAIAEVTEDPSTA